MKKLVIILAAGIFSMSNSFAGNNPDLTQEISNKVVIYLDGVELDPYSEDYVTVSFQIIDDEIKVQEINGTSAELKNKVIEELYEISVDSDYTEGRTYLYRFTFDEK